MALVRGPEALLEHEVECDVEPEDERDGGENGVSFFACEASMRSQSK